MIFTPDDEEGQRRIAHSLWKWRRELERYYQSDSTFADVCALRIIHDPDVENSRYYFYALFEKWWAGDDRYT